VSATLGALSDNLVHAATVVMALAMVGHAAGWAFTRERRTAAVAGGAGAVGPASTVAPADAGDATSQRQPRSDPGSVAVLTPPTVGPPEDASEPPAPGDRSAHRTELFNRIGIALTVLATALLGAGVLTRGLAAERVPWGNLYEFAITGSLVVAAVYLVALPRLRLGFLGLPLTGFLLVVLGIATTVLYLPVSGLIPALQSYWLAIHVSAAILATGILTLGAVASLLHLLKLRQERRAGAEGTPARGYLAQLPAAAAIERIAYRLHAFAFPIWTFALIAGAVWAAAAWGRYWGWDPKETWMFITWVCYAAYLHARATAGWRSRVSWIALIAYGALLFNLIGVNFLVSGLHSYTGL
jgi:cytochrome c-type biogenesis protein CcsB